MPKSAATSKNIIWDYYTVCESDKSKAICIFCKKMLSRGSTDPHKQTLTGMKNHIKTQHNAIFKKLESTATTHSQSSAHATAASTSATASTSKTDIKSIEKFCISRPAQPTLPSSSGSESQTEHVAVFQLQEQAGDCSMTTSSECDVSLSDVVEEEAAISVFSSSSMREEREMRQASLQEMYARKEPWAHDHPKARIVTKLIGEMMALDLQPYSIVEDKGFIRLIKHLAPNYKIPNRIHFSTKVVPLLYETIKAKVKSDIDAAECLSLTSDGWTCQHTIQSFYSLTARFINAEHEPRNIVLQVTHFPEAHTASNIKQFLEESLESWGIPGVKVHAILTDNAANVVAAVRDSSLGDKKHLPCAIHTMQLCIQNKLFREQRSVSDALAVFRDIASHFHHSSHAVSKLKEIQSELKIKQHKIIQDVSTRWNSTYYMLQRFVEQRKAITLYFISTSRSSSASKAKVVNATDNQWELAEMLVSILHHFEKATKNMSRDDASSSLILPFVYAMEKFLEYAQEQASGVKTIVTDLRRDFTDRFLKYKENRDLKVAMMMDPRFKLKYVKGTEQTTMREILCNEYFLFYSGAMAHMSDIDSDPDAPSSPSVAGSIDSDGSDSPSRKKLKLMSVDIYDFFRKDNEGTDIAGSSSSASTSSRSKGKSGATSTKKSKVQSLKEKCVDEVNCYLSLPNIPQDASPYHWWKSYKNTCATAKGSNHFDLTRFAKKALCVPPSSVMSERLFSTTGNIFEAKRNRLLPEHGEQIAFLNANMKHYL